MKKILCQIIIALSFLATAEALIVETHETLNEYIALQNFTKIDFSLNLYLKNELSFQDGATEIVNSKKVFKWLGEGGIKEDEPDLPTIYYLRSFNHFHDPLTDEGFPNGTSSVVWSQMPINRQFYGYYSWHDVRYYFYKALTLPEKDSRDDKYADLFRGLGQLMHLVEDASVPDHTRNDAHIIPGWLLDSYEPWVKSNLAVIPDGNENQLLKIKGTTIDPKTNQTNFFSPAKLLETESGFSNAANPFANLIDTNIYLADENHNPITDPSVTLGTHDGFAGVGLAEYTNANFLSHDTMFSFNYPYPKEKDCNVYLEMPPDDILGAERIYFSSTNGHLGEQVNHLAVASKLYAWRGAYFPDETEHQPIGLDPACHRDYAEKLIPKAVGYAAGFLKYFFRGEIDLVPDKSTGYGYVIQNKTSEVMDGTFELYYDNFNDIRKLVPIEVKPWLWKKRVVIPANGTSSHIDLWAEPDDIKEPGKFILVFRGNLGLEQTGAVVGKVVDISHVINISLPDTGYYAFTDKDPGLDSADPRYLEDPSSSGFDKIILNVDNIASRGELDNGTLKLIVRYRLGQGEQFQNPPESTSEAVYYIEKEYPGMVAIPRGMPRKLEFDLGDTPLPLWATDVYVYLAYQGSYGSDDDALCFGFKDASEPTAFGLLNFAHTTCLYETIYDVNDPTAKAMGDLDGDGVIEKNEWDVFPHDLDKLKIGFTTDPHVFPVIHKFDTLLAGEGMRVFVIGDYQGGYYGINSIVTPGDDQDPFHDFVLNQWEMVSSMHWAENQYQVKIDTCKINPNACAVRQYPTYSTRMGINTVRPVMFLNKVYPEGSAVCPY